MPDENNQRGVLHVDVGNVDSDLIATKQAYEAIANVLKNTQASNMVDAASDERVINNTVRHQYRVLSDEEKAHMVAIKDKTLELVTLIDYIGASADLTVAKRKAMEASFWATYHITK